MEGIDFQGALHGLYLKGKTLYAQGREVVLRNLYTRSRS